MKPYLAIFILACALVVSSCARETGTADGRGIPITGLGDGLLPSVHAASGIIQPDVAALYAATMPKWALGSDGKSILYSRPRLEGGGIYGFFDAQGILRFFPNGRVIWRFIPQDHAEDVVTIPDGFGDDFTAGYVGTYSVDGECISAEFYVTTKGGTCFALFSGTIAADGSITFTSYKTRKHGEFGLNNHTKVIQPLVFTKRTVGPMTRAADW